MVVLNPQVKKILIIAGIGIFVILGVFLLMRLGLLSQIVSRSEILLRRSSITLTPTLSPTPPAKKDPSPTPLPIAPGKQVYSIRSDSNTPGPAISEATFDPLDARLGEKLTAQVRATDTKGIQSVTVFMIDDSGKSPHDLTLLSGTKAGGIWSGTWNATSTHDRIYGATIEVLNTAKEKRVIELWFR